MTDQYKEPYKKETEQIHAPADLIARTKAAVREEEMRIQRERTVQAAGLAGQGDRSGMQQQAPAMQKKHSWGAAAHKWAYPLTAAAAIIVLVSVSVMMRGLRKSNLDSEAPYESAAAADCGGEESAAAGVAEEAAFEEAFPEAEAAAAEEAPEDTLLSEGAADAGADMETASAEAEEEAAFEAEMDSEAGTAGISAAPAAEKAEETKRAAVTDELSENLQETENATSQKQEEAILADETMADIVVKRVWRKPAFADSSEAELQIYEDRAFWVVREDEGWAAYVESENKGGYEIRGEAESMEVFLEAAYRKLEEMSF